MKPEDTSIPSTQELYLIADELRSIAANGLRFAENGYDRERYEQVRQASARLVAALEGAPAEAVLAQYTGGLPHLSPILCVEAVVLRESKVLLIRRRDDQLWALPGGVAEVGESLAQAAERELWEEAGVRGKAARLLSVLDSRVWHARTRLHLCVAQFLVETDGIPALHSPPAAGRSSFSETLDVDFFAEDGLPEMSVGHGQRVPLVFKLLRGEVETPFFDP